MHENDVALKYYKKHFEVQEKPNRQLQGVYYQAFLYNIMGEYEKAIEAWKTIIKVYAEDHDTPDGETIDWPKREIESLKNKIAQKDHA